MNEIKHISGSAGGYLVGRPHSKGGIDAIVKSTGQNINMEGGEVVITKTAVDDPELREFEGRMMTNRQILSYINESGGGVAFAEFGMEVPDEIFWHGQMYNFGGETLTDDEIVKRISGCGCVHKFGDGGAINTVEDLTAPLDPEEQTVDIRSVESWKEYFPIKPDYIPGKKKKVYRGFKKQTDDEKGTWWTGSKKQAHYFAGSKGQVTHRQIDVSKAKRTGMNLVGHSNLAMAAFMLNIPKKELLSAYHTKLDSRGRLLKGVIKNHEILENPDVQKIFLNKGYTMFEAFEPTGVVTTSESYLIFKEMPPEDYYETEKFAAGGLLTNENMPPSGNIPDKIRSEVLFLIGLARDKAQGKSTLYDINLIKSAFVTKVNKLPLSIKNEALEYMTAIEKIIGISPIFTKNHKVWKDYKPSENVVGNLLILEDANSPNQSKTIVEAVDDFKAGHSRPDVIQFVTMPKPNAPRVDTIVATDYANAYELNRGIERFLDRRDVDDYFTPEELAFIAFYSGYGGLDKFGATGKGILYEYFTPDEVVKKMWALAYKFGFGEILQPMVFEPSVGTGNFLKYAPAQAHIAGNEINPYSAKICRLLYPEAEIHLQSFEQNFIARNQSIKGKIDALVKYDLVIGNPPYGKADSKYMGMGEADYTKAGNFTEYFIVRGLDLTKSGGLLIYIVGAEQHNGGTLFLDGGISKVKTDIFEKADLVDAYRLPTKIFDRTGVASEILVFKKR